MWFPSLCDTHNLSLSHSSLIIQEPMKDIGHPTPSARGVFLNIILFISLRCLRFLLKAILKDWGVGGWVGVGLGEGRARVRPGVSFIKIWGVCELLLRFVWVSHNVI